MAAAVVNKAFDEGHQVNFQALIYPMLDDRTVLRKDDEGRGNFIWTRTDNEYAWRTYLKREPGGPDIHEYATPSRRENLAGLPATWIGVGKLDLFYEEDLTYAQRLKKPVRTFMPMSNRVCITGLIFLCRAVLAPKASTQVCSKHSVISWRSPLNKNVVRIA